MLQYDVSAVVLHIKMAVFLVRVGYVTNTRLLHSEADLKL
jgi:hypothetical protein